MFISLTPRLEPPGSLRDCCLVKVGILRHFINESRPHRCRFCRCRFRQRGSSPCAERLDKLDGLAADGQRSRLPLRRAAGGQCSGVGGASEPHRTVHHCHVDEARPKSWTEGREGDTAMQLGQDGYEWKVECSLFKKFK